MGLGEVALAICSRPGGQRKVLECPGGDGRGRASGASNDPALLPLPTPQRHSSWRSEDSCWARSESHCNYAHTCSYSPPAQPAGLETSARQPLLPSGGLSAPWPRRPPFPLQPQSEGFGSKNQSRLMESFPTTTSHLSHSPQPGVGCGEGPPHCVAPLSAHPKRERP